MGSIIMLLYIEDKKEQAEVFKFHSYLEIVKFGVVYFFLCLGFFPKLVICSCGLEIIPSQDNAITWLIIRSFATNITTGLIFSSS